MENTVNKVLPAEGYMAGKVTKALDPVETGQFGMLTNNLNWGHLRHQTKQNMFVMVLDYPRGFDALPNPDRWISMFKALIEDLPHRVEGVNWTQTPAWAETEHGGTGDMHHQMTDIKFSPTELSTPVRDREGYVIENFVTGWWNLLGLDPVSKRPGIFELDTVDKDSIVMSSDFSGGVVIAFEASECMRYVHKAQIIYNVQPKEGIESNGIRDLNAEKEIIEHNITWTGTAVRDRGAEEVARSLLTALTATSLSSVNRKAILTDINNRVKEIKVGLQNGANNVATEQL